MGISMGNFAAESAERACCACQEAHDTMAAKTNNGFKSLRIVYSIVLRMKRRQLPILSRRREFFRFLLGKPDRQD
jgi:hypothetical protein